MTKTKGVAILGSTGSIGTSALRVLSRHTDRFTVTALTAFSNQARLTEQVAAVHPKFAQLVSDGGQECLVSAATRPDVDIVLNAVVGAAGLDATLAALEAGKRVALANKETLVMAGHLVRAAMKKGGGEIVPVDSEHSAILQCLTGRNREDVRRVVLTASGGPFRDWPADKLQRATAAEALKHPTWTMGKKITVDSATLANKALEVIEAHYLFDLSYDQIDVVVHPQSVVHSFVEFIDGSVLAQMGQPSMELPILYALTHPLRVSDTGVGQFNPVKHSPLTFEPVKHDHFPALGLGIAAGRSGGAAPTVFNAANEQAVELFLAGRMAFGDIAPAIESAMLKHSAARFDTREALLAADTGARTAVKERFGC